MLIRVKRKLRNPDAPQRHVALLQLDAGPRLEMDRG